MIARRQEVLVSVRDFGVQVCDDGAAVYLHQGVQEIHRQAVRGGKSYIWMDRIGMPQEFLKRFLTMTPDTEDIIDESFVEAWHQLAGGSVQHFLLQTGHEEIRVTGRHSCAHRRPVSL